MGPTKQETQGVGVRNKSCDEERGNEEGTGLYNKTNQTENVHSTKMDRGRGGGGKKLNVEF